MTLPIAPADPYSSLLRSAKPGGAEADSRPLQKGEYGILIAKLTGEKRVLIQNVIALFRLWVAEIPKIRFPSGPDELAAAKAAAEGRVEAFARTLLTALRREEITPELDTMIRKLLYNTYLASWDFEKAVALNPEMKAAVGGRLQGIYALHRKLGGRFRKSDLLDNYFSKTPNAREGLIKILQDPTITSGVLNGPLFHFGSLLPIYYLLSNCVDFSSGLCGNCEGTSEERLRLILGDSLSTVKLGLLPRLCEFASSFS